MIIPGFPAYLSDMHHEWHQPGSHPGAGPDRVHPIGTPGGGLEFLTFHHSFMQQAFAWFATQTFNPPLDMTPWTAIPAELKDPTLSWNMMLSDQEARIDTDNPPFTSADDLGTFIEIGIHGWIHGATSAHFNEPVVGTFHSPQSTYFYKIHGLVDYWWTQWQHRLHHLGPKVIKEIVDGGIIREPKIIKDLVDTKDLSHEVIKFKDSKDILEGGIPPGLGGDPAWRVAALTQRVEHLELQVAINEAALGRAFIRAEERPEVGHDVLKDEHSGEDAEHQHQHHAGEAEG